MGFIFLHKKWFILLTLMSFVKCESNEDACIDLNDILSPTWMPGTLLEQVSSNGDEPSGANRSNNSYFNVIKSRALDGTINNALDTMIFHRSMLNQYLCRSYVANQILSEMTKNSFKRRMSSDLDHEEDITLSQKGPNNVMLDQGSSSYEDWLMKTSTLDDIYRNHNLASKINDLDNMHLSKAGFQDIQKGPQMSTKFDRDYAGVPSSDHHHWHHDHEESPAYYPHSPSHHHVSHIHKGYYKKSDKLADLVEIALTALAYLSFATFIVHLIMSICAVSNMRTSTINPRIVALNVRPAAINAADADLDTIVITESTFASEEEKYRMIKTPRKLPQTQTSNVSLNQLAKQFLNVFDSALTAHEDGGECLRNSLCNATRFSRSVNGKTKLFMALWCFGVSWLSERLSNKTASKADSLQAVLLGLGMGNCFTMYKKCVPRSI